VLSILALGSVAAIAWGLPFMDSPTGVGPKQTPMENYLFPVFATANGIMQNTGFVRATHEEGLPWEAWGTAWAISITGTVLAWFAFKSWLPSRGGTLPGPLEAARKLSYAKFYVDELYDIVIVRPVKFTAYMLYKNRRRADHRQTVGVRGTAWLTARFGSMLRYTQSGDAQSYAAVMAVALVAGIVLAMFKLWGLP